MAIPKGGDKSFLPLLEGELEGGEKRSPLPTWGEGQGEGRRTASPVNNLTI